MSPKRRLVLAMRWMWVVGILHVIVLATLAHFGIGTIAGGPPRAAPLHTEFETFAVHGLFDPLIAMLMTGVICWLLTDGIEEPAAGVQFSHPEAWAFSLTFMQLLLLIMLIVSFILKDYSAGTTVVWLSLILGFIAGLLLSTSWTRMYGLGSAIVAAMIMIFPSVIIFSLAYGFPAGAILWVGSSSAATLVSLLLTEVLRLSTFRFWASVGRWLSAVDVDPPAPQTKVPKREPNAQIAEHEQLTSRLLAISGDREKLDQEERELLERKQAL